MIRMTRARAISARSRRLRSLVGPSLKNRPSARADQAVALDGHTFNARGPLPAGFDVVEPTFLVAKLRGRTDASAPLGVELVDGVAVWTVMADLSDLIGSDRGCWRFWLRQKDMLLPLVTVEGPSVTADGRLRRNPPSTDDGTLFMPRVAANGQLTVVVKPPRPAVRVMSVVHAPGTLELMLDLRAIDRESVVEVVARRRRGITRVRLPVTAEGSRLVVNVPTPLLAARQHIGRDVRWALSLRTTRGSTRIGRVGDDVLSLNMACRFMAVVSVGADGSRVRVWPHYTASQLFGVRLTRLAPTVAGYPGRPPEEAP